MHFPESRFYLRRVRLGKDSALVAPLRAAGYEVEPAAEDPERKLVVTFPVDAAAGAGIGKESRAAGADRDDRLGGDGKVGDKSALLTLDDVGMWEQLSLAALLQRYWADNQVSCTVTFDPEREGGQIARSLDFFQYGLKGVSFLPRAAKHRYAQLPYEAVTEEVYRAAAARIRPEVLSSAIASASSKAAVDNSDAPDRFCDSAACEAAPSPAPRQS
jgi:hypothetical protein